MIERKTLTTPAPMTILRREDLGASGRSSLDDILPLLPAEASADDLQAGTGSDGGTRVTLRGLGSTRTLTLFNGRPTDTTGATQPAPEAGYHVFEGFGELSLVPISGQELVNWVELDLAARGFYYDAFGSGVAWNAGGLFRMTNGVAVRGTYATAFHAPSAAALFGATSDNFLATIAPGDTTPPGTGGQPIQLDPTVAGPCAKQSVPTDASFTTSRQREPR